LLFLFSIPAAAQQVNKVPQTGFLALGSPASYAARVSAFHEGVRELGYVEGKNIQVDYQYGEENFAPIVDRLIQRHIDLIVAGGTPPALAAKRATQQFLSW
jgi:putative tryptophan/tyrosine transport system substrate-binding protein